MHLVQTGQVRRIAGALSQYVGTRDGAKAVRRGAPEHGLTLFCCAPATFSSLLLLFTMARVPCRAACISSWMCCWPRIGSSKGIFAQCASVNLSGIALVCLPGTWVCKNDLKLILQSSASWWWKGGRCVHIHIIQVHASFGR